MEAREQAGKRVRLGRQQVCALLLGLDLGPNLAVTGSLSAFRWLQAARTVDAVASIATYSKLGAFLLPLTLAGTLAALALHTPLAF